jgi:hypothetical protein
MPKDGLSYNLGTTRIYSTYGVKRSTGFSYQQPDGAGPEKVIRTLSGRTASPVLMMLAQHYITNQSPLPHFSAADVQFITQGNLQDEAQLKQMQADKLQSVNTPTLEHNDEDSVKEELKARMKVRVTQLLTKELVEKVVEGLETVIGLLSEVSDNLEATKSGANDGEDELKVQVEAEDEAVPRIKGKVLEKSRL